MILLLSYSTTNLLPDGTLVPNYTIRWLLSLKFGHPNATYVLSIVHEIWIMMISQVYDREGAHTIKIIEKGKFIT